MIGGVQNYEGITHTPILCFGIQNFHFSGQTEFFLPLIKLKCHLKLNKMIFDSSIIFKYEKNLSEK